MDSSDARLRLRAEVMMLMMMVSNATPTPAAQPEALNDSLPKSHINMHPLDLIVSCASVSTGPCIHAVCNCHCTDCRFSEQEPIPTSVPDPMVF